MNAPHPAPPPPPPARPRYRLRTLLLMVHLIILGTPLLALVTTRLYTTGLLRQTAAALDAQAQLLAALDAPAAALPADRPLPAQLNLHRIEDATRWAPSPSAQSPDTLALPRLSATLQPRARARITGDAILTDPHGRVVASTHPALGRGLDLRNLSALRAAIVHQRALFQRHEASPLCSAPASSCMIYTAPLVRDGSTAAVLVLARPIPSLWGALSHDASALVFALSTLLVAVSLQTYYTSRVIVRPIDDLIDQSDRLASGDRDAMVPLHNPNTLEIQHLSEAIVTMARKLDDRAVYVQDFASNVSHEFKTPLASIRGAVELLTDHLDTMTDDERAHFLGMIDRHAERLQRLVTRLLALARADTLTPPPAATALHDTLRAVTQRFIDQDLRIQLTVTALDPDTRVALAHEMLDSILSNLLDNARQHGGPDVTVTVALSSEAAPNTIALDLRDDGPGISPANRAQIFAPFFTTARDQGGTGLGLAVTASLLRAHGGDLVLLDGPGAAFRLTLPTA